MNQLKKNKTRFSQSIIFSLVFLVFGFMLAYSYSLSASQEETGEYTGGAFLEQEARIRDELIEQQERNKTLREELQEKQAIINETEQSLSGSENLYASYVEEAEELRMLLGLVPVEGSGLRVTLQDGSYNPALVNPNDYIVHESHVFQVINELLIAGAEAIAINGQRIHANSYIVCTGPVIMVDGTQHPAPFIIEAIGEPNVLASSIRLTGGVLDQLVNDHIIVTLDEGLTVSMPALNENNS